MLNLLRFNPFFSQDDVNGNNPANDTGAVVDEVETNPATDEAAAKDIKDTKDKTFTQEEVNKMIDERFKRAEKDKQKAIEEAEKLAKMNADQKKEYEYEQTIKELEQYKQQVNQYSMGVEATKMLAEEGIVANEDVLAFVVKDDAEATSEAVKAFSKLIDETSDARMKDKLRGNAPKRQQGTPTTMTKAQIFEIKDSVERLKAIKANPLLFK